MSVAESAAGTVVSVNIARTATLPWRGQQVKTGIFKEPVNGPVRVHRLGLEGDFQVDKRYHGGPDKAIYLYPFEHYRLWEEELGVDELQPGAFGENLTVRGLLESDLHVGDRLQAGTALLEVTKPRMPCYKLGLKFGRPDIIKRMHVNERCGFYVSIVEEGTLEAGQSIGSVLQRPERATITDLFRRKRDD